MFTRFFATPTLLWSLAALPALGLLALLSYRRKRMLLARLGPSGVILSQVRRPRGQWRSVFGWTIGLACLAIGAAGPHWGVGPPPPTAPGRDIVVVLDLSRSMLAQDALPSRLGKAKDAIREFVDAVQSRGGHRLALVAFAGQAAIVCPLTHDYDTFRAKLAALSADPTPPAVRSAGPEAVSGTRIGAGLRKAVELLDPQFRGAEEILLVSDGDDPADDEEWRTGLAAAREAGIPVDVVGVGDPNAESPIPTEAGRLTFHGVEVRTRLKEAPLREIALRTGGLYLPARTGSAGLDVFFRDHVAAAATREAVAGALPQPIGRQTLFFACALTSILGAIIVLPSPRAAARGLTRATARLTSRARRAAALFTALVVISAAPPADWIRNGNDALSRGNPEAALTEYANAAERTTDPGLVAFNEGVALFRLGRFRDAELNFRRSLTDATGGRRVRALYNLGSSLLQESQGRLVGPLRSAVASYEQALELVRSTEPLADDLRHNLELSKRLLAMVRSANPNQPDEPPEGPRPDQSASPAARPDERDPAGNGLETATAQTGPNGQPLPKGKADGKTAPQTTGHRPPPGKGNLPPLPDEDELRPLTPEDAQAHLEKAAARIAAERNAQLKRTTPAAATRFPEW